MQLDELKVILTIYLVTAKYGEIMGEDLFSQV